MPIDKIGKYQVIGTLGTGAHSTILHVRRQADSREFALKLVNVEGAEEQKFLDQAKHEFRVAQMLNHQNLIKIHCLEMTRDWLFRVRKACLLIEYVNGKTLDESPAQPMAKLALIFLQVASALVHMHRRGVYHADMKPNNILYGKRGEVRVIDYGLAWIKTEKKDRIQGTPEFMAPETASGRIINEQTEVYNLGASIYRMATGKPPVNLLAVRESMKINEKTWASLIKPATQLNPLIPAPLAEVIHKCLEFNPGRRFERMTEVRDALRQIAEDLGEAVGDGTDAGL